jgi:CubicO group peptidase (beta-lactamase class C family)
VNLLGVLFERATGRRIDAFSAEHLFGPLGISVSEWQQLKPEIVYASGELYLRPRDLAKFGYLFLNDGVWNGTQVISKEWIEKSLQPHVSTGDRSKEGELYGYQWWITAFGYEDQWIPAYVRTGWGGQAVILFPSIDMLLIFTGGNYSGPDPLLDLVPEYILPALGM